MLRKEFIETQKNVCTVDSIAYAILSYLDASIRDLDSNTITSKYTNNEIDYIKSLLTGKTSIEMLEMIDIVKDNFTKEWGFGALYTDSNGVRIQKQSTKDVKKFINELMTSERKLIDIPIATTTKTVENKKQDSVIEDNKRFSEIKEKISYGDAYITICYSGKNYDFNISMWDEKNNFYKTIILELKQPTRTIRALQIKDDKSLKNSKIGSLIKDYEDNLTFDTLSIVDKVNELIGNTNQNANFQDRSIRTIKKMLNYDAKEFYDFIKFNGFDGTFSDAIEWYNNYFVSFKSEALKHYEEIAKENGEIVDISIPERASVFYGDAGCGKSYKANEIIRQTGGFRVACHPGLTIESLMVKPKSGNVLDLECGVLFQVLKHGGTIVLDEFHLLQTRERQALQTILDNNGLYKNEITGETIEKIHPNFRIIYTQNVYEGYLEDVKEAKALYDRVDRFEYFTLNNHSIDKMMLKKI